MFLSDDSSCTVVGLSCELHSGFPNKGMLFFEEWGKGWIFPIEAESINVCYPLAVSSTVERGSFPTLKIEMEWDRSCLIPPCP